MTAAARFADSRAEELLRKLPEASGWYGRFVQRVVMPNAAAFGYVIEIAELLAGVALLGGALVGRVALNEHPPSAVPQMCHASPVRCASSDETSFTSD